MTAEQLTAILHRIDAIEQANAERHEELTSQLAEVLDAATCADITAEEVRTRLGQVLSDYGA
jgi:hypothetical protein